MSRKVLAVLAGTMLLCANGALAQDKPADKPLKIAILNIQAAIAQSNDGQKAAKELNDKFAPRRAELEKQQKEINDLQEQLNSQGKTLTDDARSRMVRSVDDKTKAFNRANEDASADYQQAEQDAVNEIGRKMMGVISEYSQKSGFTMVLDVSSPQTPVLYADAGIDITQTVIDLYNKAVAAAPAASAAPGGSPAKSPAPAASTAKPSASAPAH